MTFNPLASICVARALPHLTRMPTVLELGNQRLTVNPKAINIVVDILKKNSINYDETFLHSLKTMDKEKMKPLTEAFYKSLSFKSYNSIDLNDNFNAYQMDLNLDLRDHYQFTTQYDLVTNNGTGEHIFNQHSVFKNMHQLTKPEGLMLHIMPFVNWINHGFYNFHPILYLDLAEANGYELISMSFADNQANNEVFVDINSHYKAEDNLVTSRMKGTKTKQNPFYTKTKSLLYNAYSSVYLKLNASKTETIPLKWAVKSLKTFQSKDPLNMGIQKLLYKGTNVSITVLLKKKSDHEFRSPIQGKYFSKVDLVPNQSL